ncbi:MAG: AAA family ATPase [Candidatus Bathyarchaeia archaeon]
MPRRRLILITGMPGSGKTTVARFFEELGYRVQTMGDVIRVLAEERRLEPTPRSIGSIAEAIRRDEGEAAVARRCIEKLSREEPARVVVDGVRSLAEVEAFREAFDVVLVAVHASQRTRFNRLRERGREDDPKDFETFAERDRRELEFSMGSAVAMADCMIVNEGSLRDLRRAFEALMERLREE